MHLQIPWSAPWTPVAPNIEIIHVMFESLKLVRIISATFVHELFKCVRVVGCRRRSCSSCHTLVSSILTFLTASFEAVPINYARPSRYLAEEFSELQGLAASLAKRTILK
jgi:hypothetical protein